MNYKGGNKIVYQDDEIVKFLVESPKYGNFEIIIDAEDYDKVKPYRWHLKYDKKEQRFQKIYADILIEDKKKMTSLHWLITKYKYCDHKNLSIFDNRKDNLRECNHSTNAMNRLKPKNNTSGHKGIYFTERVKKWQAHIKVGRKQIHLGYYTSKHCAACAYNNAAIKHFGEFACLNQI